MMRKTLVCLLAGSMLLFSACGANNVADDNTDDAYYEESDDDAEDADEDEDDNASAQEETDASDTADTDEENVADADADADETDDNAEPDESQWDEIMNFTVQDLDKNDIRLGDIISQNDVTLINYWGTFCGPCIHEMPDLAELEKKYKDQGFEIIGVTCDIANPDGSLDDDAIADAKSILADTGVEYPVVIASNELNKYINSDVVPVSFFVDENGNRLSDVIIGGQDKDTWEDIISTFYEE